MYKSYEARNIINAQPVCASCFGLTPDAEVIVQCPILDGRFAKCSYCGKMEKSALSLAFFKLSINNGMDEFYCGCRGWE